MKDLLKVRNLEKQVKVKGKNRKLLDDLSFDIQENEFVAIVGVSGAGKTTLLNALSGYDRKVTGHIYLNNQEIFKNRKYYQSKISYVPQKEILHNHLTLEKSLFYSGCLRIPDVDKDSIKKKVAHVIKELSLEGREATMIKKLSGGEKKRASIASELLTKPDILFLDEPTSGLDSNIEKSIMKTLRNLKDEGRTIVITAHTISNLYLCDRIIFMSEGGKICFIGSYEESLKYFNVSEFVDIYEKLKDPIEMEYYQKKYKKKPLIKVLDTNVNHKKKLKVRIPMIKEVFLLSRRYLEIISNSRIFCFMLFFQAILMGICIDIVAKPDWLQIYDKAKILLFAFSCAAMWLGLFNSVQEIVKERDIIKLEFFKNMRLTSYIISKLLVFAGICVIQSFLFLLILSLRVDFPTYGILLDSAFLEYLLCFFLVCFSSSILGMFISSVVKTCEITLILTPLYMMFQLIFSGVLIRLEGIGDKISNLIIGRYAVESFGITTNLIDVLHHTKLGGVLDTNMTTQIFINEAKDYYTYTVAHMNHIFFILGIIMVMFVFLSILSIHINIKRSSS